LKVEAEGENASQWTKEEGTKESGQFQLNDDKTIAWEQ